jgi:nucleoside-diphosphate-sugar epimerase
MKDVVVVGGMGYLGRPLIERLCADGFRVASVARPSSATKVPTGCRVILGDALDSRSYLDHVPPGSTFVHLVGVPHPAPWKAAEFRSIDLVSLEQSLGGSGTRGG